MYKRLILLHSIRPAPWLGDCAVHPVWHLLCQVSCTWTYGEGLPTFILSVWFSHNNKTAMYQHPYHSRPPPPYHRTPHSHEADQRDRRPPPRSHSYRSVCIYMYNVTHCSHCSIPSYRDTQNYRVMDPNASLPRRSKSFKDQETQDAMAAVWHSKQLSTVTYVPPSPYQIAGKNHGTLVKTLARWLLNINATFHYTWKSVKILHFLFGPCRNTVMVEGVCWGPFQCWTRLFYAGRCSAPEATSVWASVSQCMTDVRVHCLLL